MQAGRSNQLPKWQAGQNRCTPRSHRAALSPANFPLDRSAPISAAGGKCASWRARAGQCKEGAGGGGWHRTSYRSTLVDTRMKHHDLLPLSCSSVLLRVHTISPAGRYGNRPYFTSYRFLLRIYILTVRSPRFMVA